MLRFPYQDEPLIGPAPPSMPRGATVRRRPLVPDEVIGPGGVSCHFSRAVVDPAADDTIFTLDTASLIGLPLLPDTGHRIVWRGQLHPLRFGKVELVLTDGITVLRWPAMVGFSPAKLRCPLLGQAGCLQYIDAFFQGWAEAVELEPNHSYPGTVT